MPNRKRIQDVLMTAALIMSVVMLTAPFSGCNGMVPGADTPKQQYLKARMTFNGLLADYIADKRQAPPATRAKWTKDIDPYFEKGGVALKAWGTALKAGATTYDQQMAYLDLKNELLDILLTELTDYE